MSEIKYVIEVDDSQVEKVFDNIEQKAIDVGQSFSKGNKEIEESVKSITDAYSDFATEGSNVVDLTVESTNKLIDANYDLEASYKRSSGESKGFMLTQEELAKSNKQYFTSAKELANNLKDVDSAQKGMADSGKGVAESYDDIADKATVVEKLQSQIVEAVGDKFKRDVQDTLDIYSNMPIVIQNAYQQVQNLEGANKRLTRQQEELNKSVKDGSLSQTAYLKASLAVGAHRDKTNQQLAEAKEKVRDLIEQNKGLADSDNGVNENLKIRYRYQENIINSIKGEYKKSIFELLNSYRELDSGLKTAYQNVNNIEQANKRLVAQQSELNAALQKGQLSQGDYMKGTVALNVERDKTNKYLIEARKNLDALQNTNKNEITSIAEKTAKLTELKKKWDELSDAQRKNANVGGKISQEYQTLTKEIEKANSGLTGMQKGTGQVLGVLGKVGSALGIAFGVQQLVSFGMEIFEISKKVEGVSLAFAKLGQGEQGLQKLREATRGTVDDLKLMTLAVDASNFKIPLDTLSKGLAFAGRRAQDTGKSVDYLVESFVTGMGRKSTVILDNLGISLVEIQDEVKKVGDFNIAIGNIIDREMARAGDAVDTLGSKTSRLTTIWENAKIKIASAVADIFGDLDQSKIDKMIGSATEGMKSFEKASNNAQKEIISNRQKEIDQLQKNIDKNKEYQKLVVKYETRDVTDKNLAQLQEEEKSLKEQLTARRAVLTNMRDINKEVDKQDRLRKGIVSDAELEEKISKLRADANQWIVKDNSDQEYKNKLLKEANKLEKQLASRNGKSDNEAEKRALAERKKLAEQIERDEEKRVGLLEKYATLNNSFSNTQLENNEQEIQSVREKYATLTREFEKYNKDTKGRAIELDKLASDEATAIAIVQQKQAYALELKGLEDRSKLWTEYEDLKNKIGSEKAKERYALLLKDGVSYEQDLRDAIENIQSKPIKTGQDLEQIKKYEEQLKAFADAKRKQENAKYTEALELAKGYNDRLLDIEKQYNDAVVALGAKATDEQIANLKKWKAETMSNLSMDELSQSNTWTDVFVNILDQTKIKAQESISVLKDALKKMLDEGKITLKEYTQAIKNVKDVDIKIRTSGRGLDNLKNAIKVFKEAKGMAKEDALGNLGKEIDSQIQKVTALGGEIGNIFSQMGVGSDKAQEDLGLSLDALSSAGSATAKFMSGDFVGAAVDAIATVGKVINIFSKDRKLDRSIKEKAEAVGKLNEAFKQLGKAIDNSVGESFYTDSQKQIENLKQQQVLIKSMMRDEEQKKKTDKGKIAEYKNQLEAIEDKILDINKSITEMLVQTSFKALSDSLADALVSAFNAGEDGIKSMNKTFNDFIKGAITNSLKLKLIEPVVNELIDNVSKYMLGNNNSLAGFNMDDWRKKFEVIGGVFNEQLQELYNGLGLKTENDEAGLQGALRREMTEATASELTGLFRSQYDITKRSFEFDMQQGMKYVSLMQDSLRGINAIQQNTHLTAERLLQTNESLLLIVKNTNALNEKYA